jgi:hypothetical protein
MIAGAWRGDEMRGRALWTLLVVLTAGCSGSMGTIATAVLSPPALPMRTIGRVEGRDCAGLLFGVVGGTPSLDRAIRQALTQAPGAAALANAQLVDERGGVPPVWMSECLVVRGDAVAVGTGS